MNGKVKHLQGAKHFRLEELLEMGRRLTEEQLDSMGLMSAVVDAEVQAYWRLRGALELLGPLAAIHSPDLAEAVRKAESQMSEPKRGKARLKGRRPKSGGRVFPRPGTLIVKDHRYQSYNVPTVTVDGASRREPFRTFRFVVVDHPSTLLMLGDSEDRIFRNPSNAASAATGNDHEPGWDFFGANSWNS